MNFNTYWQSMALIIVMAFGITSCCGSSGGDERRVVCSDGFESPWAYIAWVDEESPTAGWRMVSGGETVKYHIPTGVSCQREIRDIVPEHQSFNEDGEW